MRRRRGLCTLTIFIPEYSTLVVVSQNVGIEEPKSREHVRRVTQMMPEISRMTAVLGSRRAGASISGLDREVWRQYDS